MSDHLEEFWKWARTAPLPVVLAITIVLGGWVWRIATNQEVDRANVSTLGLQVDRMDTKLDRLLDAVADVRAEQRVLNSTAAAPRKEKD